MSDAGENTKIERSIEAGNHLYGSFVESVSKFFDDKDKHGDIYIDLAIRTAVECLVTHYLMTLELEDDHLDLELGKMIDGLRSMLLDSGDDNEGENGQEERT